MRIVDPQNFFFFFSIHDLDLLGRKYKLLISIKLGNQWNIVFYIYKLGKVTIYIFLPLVFQKLVAFETRNSLIIFNFHRINQLPFVQIYHLKRPRKLTRPKSLYQSNIQCRNSWFKLITKNYLISGGLLTPNEYTQLTKYFLSHAS